LIDFNVALDTACCARRLLSMEEDFRIQKGMIQEAIETQGHIAIFYPKFHCEINFIEYFWSAAKHYTLDNCSYSLEGLRKIIPEALMFINREKIWKYHQKTLRIMDAYREGLNYGEKAFQKKVYKSHRRVPEANTMPDEGGRLSEAGEGDGSRMIRGGDRR